MNKKKIFLILLILIIVVLGIIFLLRNHKQKTAREEYSSLAVSHILIFP